MDSALKAASQWFRRIKSEDFRMPDPINDWRPPLRSCRSPTSPGAAAILLR